MVTADEKISYEDPTTGRKIVTKISQFEKMIYDLEQIKKILNNHAEILRDNNLKLKIEAEGFDELDISALDKEN